MKFNLFNIRLWIILIALILLGIISIDEQYKRNDRIIASDVIEYYAYLPTLFIYHDISLDFVNTYKGPHTFTIWTKKTETGKNVVMTSAGLAYLYAPFFFAGHIAAKVFGYDSGGYSMPYRLALMLCTWVWMIIGLIFISKILKKYFTDKAVVVTLVSIVFGTNLLWFSCFDAPMAHVYGFSLFAVFIFFTLKWHEKPNLPDSIWIGLLTGLIVLIRPTNILIILFFALYGITSFADIILRIRLFFSKYYLVMAMALCAILIWIPQMAYWKAMTGHYFYYSYGNDEGFFWRHPHIFEGLFGYRKGWLLYTPLMILPLFGIILLRKKLKAFLLPILLFLPLNIYVVLSWWCWWYGGGFGLRGFIDSYALLSIPLAALIAYSLERRWKFVLLPLLFILIFHNSFMTRQVLKSIIHYDSMTSSSYWAGFGHYKLTTKITRYLELPDYDKARKGIAASKYFPGYIHSWMMYGGKPYAILPSDPPDEKKPFTMFQRSPETLDTISAPVFSLTLDKSSSFGLNYSVVDVMPYDIFKIYVKRKSSKHKGSMVCCDDLGAKFIYSSTDKARPIPGTSWELLTFTASVPPGMKGQQIKLYAWNPTDEPVEFGDLFVVKVQEGF